MIYNSNRQISIEKLKLLEMNVDNKLKFEHGL